MRRLLLVLCSTLCLLALTVVSSARATVTWWQPSSAHPLPLH
ncbi:MAG: hypothetical protein QOJ11_3099 [Frankiales bacterium]|jgi:hypothetical protein|nr:hypothetical protein [Frankiales bacterium]